MVQHVIESDVAVLDLLRKNQAMTVSSLAKALGVTATAIRQRLTRLMEDGCIERAVVPTKRGRPQHEYTLTSKGRRQTGENFGDLAMVLWQEIRTIEDPVVRRGLIERVSQRMAGMYADQISGTTVEQRMLDLAALFAERRLPLEVDQSGELPVLSVGACPYPELAEQDRSVCSMERMLISEIVGETVRLSQCRLDGDCDCTFELSAPESQTEQETKTVIKKRPVF